MKVQLKKGSTSNILQIFIADSSSSTGAGLTGLTQAASGLTAYYHRDTDTTATAITLVTMTVGTFTSSGFKEIDSTNMPGWYQFCPPNAAFASGAASCGLHLKGVTNMAPLPIEVELIAVDLQDTVRLGLTALPNAVAEAAGGLYTRGTGAGQINQPANGQIDANTVKVSGTAQTARDLGASVLLSSGTGTGQLSLSSGTVTVGTNSDKTGYGLSAAAVQAIWDALTSALTTVGSIGKLIVTNLDAAITSRLSTAGYTVPPTVSAIENAVWDATASSHNTSLTMGSKLNSAASAGDPWSTSVPGAYAAGSAGYVVGNNLNAAVSTRATPAQVQTSVAAELDAAGAELVSAPADNGTIRQKLQFIYQYFAYKRTITVSEVALYKANSITVLATTAVSDDGTTVTQMKGA